MLYRLAHHRFRCFRRSAFKAQSNVFTHPQKISRSQNTGRYQPLAIDKAPVGRAQIFQNISTRCTCEAGVLARDFRVSQRYVIGHIPTYERDLFGQIKRRSGVWAGFYNQTVRILNHNVGSVRLLKYPVK